MNANALLAPLLQLIGYLNPWRKSRLETYILQSCLAMVGSVLLIISGLILLVDYVEISRALAGRADLNGIVVMGLVLEKAPSAILILLPFAFLFGSIFAFVTLNRRSELIAMRAAGVSAWRFVFPAATMAFVIGVATISALNPIASWLSDNYDRTVAAAPADGGNAAPAHLQAGNDVIYLRQGDGRQQVVIRAASTGPVVGHLNNATFWVYNMDRKELPVFQSRIDVREAVLQPGQWLLKGAREYTLDDVPHTYETQTIPSNLNLKTVFRKYASTASVPFWQLPGLIHQNDISGFSSTAYRLKLQQLLSTPLMFAGMSLLGAVFCLRLMRLGGMTQLVVSGVVLGFIVFFVNQLFSSMGKAEIIPVFLAGWTPAILALLTGMTLLVYTEDG
jgi:lipopolysaccharide export system permease protein